MTDYVDLAKQALTKPSDFGWWGSDSMFDTWGFAGINKTGENYLVDISNWHSVIADLKHEFGDDVYNANFLEANLSHYACGSVDQLCVKILEKSVPHSEITDDIITPYFKKVVDIALYIHNEYPIWNENDHCDRQYEETNRWIEELLKSNYIPLGSHTIFSEGIGSEVQSWLLDNYYDCCEYADDGTPVYDEDDIAIAVYHLHYDNRVDDKSDAFWSNWEVNNHNEFLARRNKRDEESGQLTFDF